MLSTDVITGVWVLLGVVAAATAAGLVRRRRDGRIRAPRAGHDPAAPAGRPAPAGSAGARLSEADLGRPLGSTATLVQFSSSFCAPCRAARQLLRDVCGQGSGVAHIDIDVADRMDLVEMLGIRRTPTVLVLGPAGEVTGRAVGVPRRAEVMAALAQAGSDSGGGHV